MSALPNEKPLFQKKWNYSVRLVFNWVNVGTTGFKTSFGCDWLQSLWICVLGKKGSQRALARFRALFTSGLDHKLFAQSRYKTGFETSCN